MIQLLLLRHAKSSWANPEIDDFDRTLNKRGKRSAKAIGRWFRQQAITPDTVLCSSARRCKETWDSLKLEATAEFRDDLYLAEPDALLNVVRGASGASILLIAHNPGIAAIAGSLAAAPPDHPRFADFPTGALADLRFDADSASAIASGSGTVSRFLTPHDLVFED